jgi:squalene-hopene/tetraprenyl-beta-curcumene cyclase
MRHAWLAGLLGVLALTGAARAQGDGPKTVDPKEKQEVLDRAIAFLKAQQGADGSFSAKNFGPGPTALVAAALLKNGVGPQNPVVAKALEYLKKHVRKDGGVYDKGLANYTTSVAIMTFKEANTGGQYNDILKKAADFLKGIQNDEDKDHLRGGFGYDKKSQPDLSNTNFSVEAMLAAGMSKDDPAIKEALKFIGNCQNLPGENKQGWAAKASKDDRGGFVYKPDPEDKQHATPDGGLRSAGAMTYGGLKSFLYAGVGKDDPRVKAAVGWIRAHYTLKENPGMGQKGLYYYYHTFAKAMDALGEEPFADASGQKHFWRAELFQSLRTRQGKDGGWTNATDRTFGEADPNIATAFALLALSFCETRK